MTMLKAMMDRGERADMGSLLPASNPRLIRALNHNHNMKPRRVLSRSRHFPTLSMNNRIRHAAAAFLTAALLVSAAPAGAQTPLTVASPDARTEVRVEIRDGHLVYSVTRDRRPL